jgi:multicomponent Na+:H+ antiporter subunit F
MSAFLLFAGAFILLTVLLGLLDILRRPSDLDRMLAAQLLGTGGVAALLLLGSSIDLTGATDLALVLVLLGAFAAVAFVAGLGGDPGPRERPDPAATSGESGCGNSGEDRG